MFIYGDMVQFTETECWHSPYRLNGRTCPRCFYQNRTHARLFVDFEGADGLVHVFNLVTKEREVWAPATLALIGGEDA